jgi:hypothetical protein
MRDEKAGTESSYERIFTRMSSLVAGADVFLVKVLVVGRGWSSVAGLF